MSHEASKVGERWNKNGFGRYFVGRGVDIGCGNDPITNDCDRWDLELGNTDAQFMDGVADNTYDWVFSCHCLEHLLNPREALKNWYRITKLGGYIIVVVPDEDLYEQGVWPSVFNPTHVHTFTTDKNLSWCPDSISLTYLVNMLPDHKLIHMSIVDTGYIYGPEKFDRTDKGAEACIEMIVQKAPPQPTLMLNYDRGLVCPQCGGSDLMVRGVKNGEVQLRCKCGVTGGIDGEALGLLPSKSTDEVRG